MEQQQCSHQRVVTFNYSGSDPIHLCEICKQQFKLALPDRRGAADAPPVPGGAAWVPHGQGPALVQWLLTIQSDGKVQFKRLCNGTVDESYRTATASEAPAWAAAVVSGFEPPRLLVPSDRPRSIGVA